MLRFLIFLIVLVPVVMAGNWLIAHPGMVDIAWLGYAVSMQVSIMAALLLVLCLVVIACVLLLWQVTSWPKHRRARKRYRTLAAGLDQLTHGVTALALGDEKMAHIALKKAVKALPGEPLPKLLSAQLLQRQGAHDAARLQLRSLLNHPATAMLASKRLIEQHMLDAEWDAATHLAEQVVTDAPRERWAVIALLDLYARQGNTQGMLRLSEGFQWQSPLSKDERNRFAARAYYLQSMAAEHARARRHALRHAVGFAPDFLPALIAYADVLVHAGEARQARKWLLTGWLAKPRPILIDPILHSMAQASPKAQSRLLKPFLTGGTTYEHAMLRATHALEQQDAATAHAALEDALRLQETRQACQGMAQAEKYLHGDEAANRWLGRAMCAAASESWLCETCGTAHDMWQIHCSHCSAFDSLHYMRPEARITSVELTTA